MFAHHETIENQNERVAFWKQSVNEQKLRVEYWEKKYSAQNSDINIDSMIKGIMPEEYGIALGNIVIDGEVSTHLQKEKDCLAAIEKAHVAVEAELTAMTALLEVFETSGADLAEARAKVERARTDAMSAEAEAVRVVWQVNGLFVQPPIRMEVVQERHAMAAARAAEVRARLDARRPVWEAHRMARLMTEQAVDAVQAVADVPPEERAAAAAAMAMAAERSAAAWAAAVRAMEEAEGVSTSISQPETRPVDTGWRFPRPRLSLFSRPRTGGMATRKKYRRRKRKTKHYKKKTKRYTKK